MRSRWPWVGLGIVVAAGGAAGWALLRRGPDSETREDAAVAASGRCSIVGVVRRDGKPAAARVEARLLHRIEEWRQYEAASYEESAIRSKLAYLRPLSAGPPRAISISR